MTVDKRLARGDASHILFWFYTKLTSTVTTVTELYESLGSPLQTNISDDLKRFGCLCCTRMISS